MQRGRYNPGSIHVRVGAIQEAMEKACLVGNMVVYGNLLRRFRIYASVYMDDDAKKAYDAMPGLSEDKRTPSQVFEDMALKEEFLLALISEKGDVFTKARHEKGDASALDDEAEEQVEA